MVAASVLVIFYYIYNIDKIYYYLLIQHLLNHVKQNFHFLKHTVDQINSEFKTASNVIQNSELVKLSCTNVSCCRTKKVKNG